jgi:hypothetical protein
MKHNVIVTASDRHYGDFLIEHWFASLRDTTKLDDIDVAVLDYGLSRAQRYWLSSHKIAVRSGIRDGHVAVIRYRDFSLHLKENPFYRQACLCDSGDIIFQGDISPVFTQDTEQYRAVCEDYKPMFSVFISPDFFSKADRKRLSACFVENPMINAGFIVGPREAMVDLADTCIRSIRDWSKFGPDQIVVNGHLYEKGFKRLDSLWNYVIATAKSGVHIENGTILTLKGNKPVVVHNAGNVGALRPIENFGYGPDRNHLREEVLHALHALYQSSDGLFKTQELFTSSRRKFQSSAKRLLEELKPR